jgi:quinol monooxygenase YgiN
MRHASRCRSRRLTSYVRCFRRLSAGADLISSWRVSCDETGEAISLIVQRRKKQTLIVFSMQIMAPDDKRTAIMRTLGSLLGPTRAAAGCMQAQLYTDLDRRKILFLVEEWESREQFERSLGTTKINTIVAAIELSNEAPVVRVDSVERDEGVHTLALHRQRAEDSSDS